MARAVMAEIMDGTATNAQMGAFLAALRMKGETVTEITACAEVMREKGLKVEVPFDVMEIVGTGGDEVGTFNISTTSAFVVAAGGVPVAKHGNRSVSSRSGAADVLERLGARLDLTPEQNVEVLKESQYVLYVCTGLPYIHEKCRSGEKRDGRPDDLQYFGGR